jgi:TPR repeat protein
VVPARGKARVMRVASSIWACFMRTSEASQNDTDGVKWYRFAAEQGNDHGQAGLAQMHTHGRGVMQDEREAARWFRLAANQGNVGAQQKLGEIYQSGVGVAQDMCTAYMWFNLAGASGEKDAIRRRDQIAQTMTPSQIEKGQDLTRDFLAKNDNRS